MEQMEELSVVNVESYCQGLEPYNGQEVVVPAPSTEANQDDEVAKLEKALGINLKSSGSDPPPSAAAVHKVLLAK